MLTPDLFQEITRLSDLLRAKFTPSEFIPGCEVMDITDVSQYATNNGWIEAICGQHNQQRVRWKSAEPVIVGDFIDVIYFPDRRVFEAWGIGGAGAIAGTGGGWPYGNVLTVSTTDPDADHATIADAITAASAGDVILLDAETYTGPFTLNKNVTLKGSAQGDTILTQGTAGATLILSTAGAIVEDLTVISTYATGTVKAVDITASCRLRNVIAQATGAATTGCGIAISGATVDLIGCEASSTGATTKIGLDLSSSAVVSVYGGVYGGATYDMLVDTSTLNLFNPVLTNNILLAASSTVRGGYFDAAGKDYPRSAFAANKNATDQTGIVNNTFTKLTATTEILDAAGDYDAANSKHTPLTPGYYLYTATVTWLTPTDQSRLLISIYKNGAEHKRGATNASGTAVAVSTVTALVAMNGTTDYVEIYVFHNTGVNQSVAGSVPTTHVQGVLMLRS